MGRTVLRSASAIMELTVTTSLGSAPVALVLWDDTVNKVCQAVLLPMYSYCLPLFFLNISFHLEEHVLVLSMQHYYYLLLSSVPPDISILVVILHVPTT